MPVDVDVEHVFPEGVPGRPGFQAGHRHPGAGKGFQQEMQGAGAVGRGHDDRGLVLARGAGIVAPENEEARRVVGFVLDVFGEFGQIVAGRRRLAGDSRCALLFGRLLGRLGIAADGNARRVGKVAVEPFVALGKRLGVGIDLGDLLQPVGPGQQVLVDAQHDFAANLEGRREQQIHGPPHRAFGGILHRHHGVMGVGGFDFAKNVVDRGLRQKPGGMAEMLGGGGFGKGTQGAEEGNAQGLFQRKAGRHDLAEEPGDLLVAQGPGVVALDAPQHLGLPLGTVDVAGLAVAGLDFADLLSAAGALVEQLEKLAVDAVDFGADAGQFLGEIVAHAFRRAKSFMKSTSTCTPARGMAL